MNHEPLLPPGMILFAEGGVRSLGQACEVLRNAGIEASLVRPPKDCGSGG
ncbi:MAG: hypothetical protein U1F36_18480 [Planctomycetota bacterium]